MIGRGWTWIGSSGAVSSSFNNDLLLQRAMQGMIGFRPTHAGGKVFEKLSSFIKKSSNMKEHVSIAIFLQFGFR